MVVAPQLLGLKDYLNFTGDPDQRYDLENGELRAMPPESDLNQRIASVLFAYFLHSGIPPYRLRIGNTPNTRREGSQNTGLSIRSNSRSRS